jgi:hypothetical protein
VEHKMVEDYSDYVKHRSNLITIFVLLCGFTFTATTFLVTQLPQRGSFSSQLILLFSDFLLDLFVFLLLLNTVNIFFYIEKIPEPTRTTNFISLMSAVSIGLWGFLLPSIFFLFDLTLLALVSTAMWAFILVSGIVIIWKPFEQRRRKIPARNANR